MPQFHRTRGKNHRNFSIFLAQSLVSDLVAGPGYCGRETINYGNESGSVRQIRIVPEWHLDSWSRLYI